MRLRANAVMVVLGMSALWTLGGTQRERPLLAPTVAGSLAGSLAGPLAESLGALEVNATAHPTEPGPTRKLAQAYLDAHQPGLAVVLLSSATAPIQADVRAQHLLARALLDQGRNDQALAAEARVVAQCGALLSRGANEGAATGCDGLLLTSAVRRVSILREMLSFGVEDTQAHPEASFIAYRNATHETQVRFQ